MAGIPTVYTIPAPAGPWNADTNLGYGYSLDGIDNGGGSLKLPAVTGTGLKYSSGGFPELWTIQTDVVPRYVNPLADPNEIGRVLNRRLVEPLGAAVATFDDSLPDIYGLVTCGVGGVHREIPFFWGRGSALTFSAQSFSLKFYSSAADVLGSALKGVDLYAWASRGSIDRRGLISSAAIQANLGGVSANAITVPPGAVSFTLHSYSDGVGYKDPFATGKTILNMRLSRLSGSGIKSTLVLTEYLRGVTIPLDPSIRYIGLENGDAPALGEVVAVGATFTCQG